MKFLETVKSVAGEPQHLEYHQRRVHSTLHDSTHNLADILSPPKNGIYRCRVVYDKEMAEVTYYPYILKIPQSFKILHIDDFEYSRKYEDRSNFQRLIDENRTYDEILILKNRLFTDTSIANVAFLKNGRWITPKKPLLYGTTRMRLIESGFLHTEDICIDNLDKFDGFGVMNALTGFQIIKNGIMSLKK